MSRETDSLTGNMFSAISNGIGKLFSNESKNTSVSEKKYASQKKSRTENQISKVYVSSRGTRISKIPVDVKLKTKPSFLYRLKKVNTAEHLDVSQLKALASDLNKPQRIEIKVTEISAKDEKDLWDVSQYNKMQLKDMIKKSLTGCINQGFKIESLEFEEGCLLIVIILKAFSVAISILGIITTFLKDYDKIKENYAQLTKDTKELRRRLLKYYQEFNRSIENTIRKIEKWFGNSGWGFSGI